MNDFKPGERIEHDGFPDHENIYFGELPDGSFLVAYKYGDEWYSEIEPAEHLENYHHRPEPFFEEGKTYERLTSGAVFIAKRVCTHPGDKTRRVAFGFRQLAFAGAGEWNATTLENEFVDGTGVPMWKEIFEEE